MPYRLYNSGILYLIIHEHSTLLILCIYNLTSESLAVPITYVLIQTTDYHFLNNECYCVNLNYLCLNVRTSFVVGSLVFSQLSVTNLYAKYYSYERQPWRVFTIHAIYSWAQPYYVAIFTISLFLFFEQLYQALKKDDGWKC